MASREWQELLCIPVVLCYLQKCSGDKLTWEHGNTTDFDAIGLAVLAITFMPFVL